MENLISHRVAIQRKGCIFGGGAGGCSCPVALDDIGRAAAAVLADESEVHDNRAYKIVGPEALSPADVAQRLGEGLGREIAFVDQGVEAFYGVSEGIPSIPILLQIESLPASGSPRGIRTICL